MTATLAIRGQDGGPLGRWIVGPLVGLAVLLGAIAVLPSHGCGHGITLTDSTAGIFYLALAVAATVIAVGAGIWRFRALGGDDAGPRGGEWRNDDPADGRSWTDPRVIGAALFVVAVAALAILGGSEAATVLFFVVVLGLPATGGAFFLLLVAWVKRRKADEVGLTLPLYLLGSGLFVYPPLVDLVASTLSGTYRC